MLRNNKGFSLIELFAMILISTVIIFPLMQALVKNIEINARLHQRRNATNIAEGSLYTLDKLDFTDLLTLVTAENVAGNFYLELNLDNCTVLATVANENLCNYLFNSVWNNLSLSSSEYRIFIYNFSLPQPALDSLLVDSNIPIEVRQEIGLNSASNALNTTLLRVTIWIEYFQDPVYTLVLSGMIFDE